MAPLLSCGHPGPDTARPGEKYLCRACPPSSRSNESRTMTWQVYPLREVVAP